MIKQTWPATPGTSVEKVHLGCRLNVAWYQCRKRTFRLSPKCSLINNKEASTEPKEYGPICRSLSNHKYA